MSGGDDERSPLLAAAAGHGKNPAQPSAETTPLLSGAVDQARCDGEHDEPVDEDPAVSTRSRSSQTTSKPPRRWASFIAMGILAILVVAIIVLAFVVPDAIQQYAQEATVIEPTNLSIDSITSDGVKARVQAIFRLDSSRVANEHVRRVGQATTWIARQLGSEQTSVTVVLPDKGNTLLGTAVIPPVVLNLRDGDTTYLDFIANVVPGDVDGIREIANEWLLGQLDSLRLKGVGDLTLHSGLLPLGTHTVAESFVFEADKIPTVPQYNITRLTVEDVPAPGNRTSMVADVSISAYNEFPVELKIPELAFEILVPGCANDPRIIVADAVTSEVLVKPHADVLVDVHGLIRELPETLTHACPNTNSSPLDLLLEQYMHGDPATMFVRGSSNPDGSTPKWIAEILSSVTIPVPFPGRSLDGLIRNFSLTDVHFSLPDPFAEPDDPDANPKVSGNILVTAGLPSEMNFGINVTKVRAFADVFYKSKKLGELNLEEWQDSSSKRVEASDGGEATLQITSQIIDAPLKVTDEDVFTDVLQTLMFGGKAVLLDIKAAVDIKVETSLGQLVVKEIPAEGRIPVKPISGGDGPLLDLAPKVESIRILDTTQASIILEAVVSVTNPTPYTATIPYLNIHIAHGGSTLGEVTVRDMSIVHGINTGILVTATWAPSSYSPEGRQIGRDLVSEYISGFNTSIAIKAHRNSIPGQPIIGGALARLNLTMSPPKLNLPGDSPDETSHFIRDAVFHFLTSTAIFTLVSPLQYNSIYIDFVNATALYNHTEPIGKILYRYPFEAPPGKSQTPRLPVQWSVGSVGYDAVKNALGGTLKLDAMADVDIRLGNYKESFWYKGSGIGARVEL